MKRFAKSDFSRWILLVSNQFFAGLSAGKQIFYCCAGVACIVMLIDQTAGASCRWQWNKWNRI